MECRGFSRMASTVQMPAEELLHLLRSGFGEQKAPLPGGVDVLTRQASSRRALRPASVLCPLY